MTGPAAWLVLIVGVAAVVSTARRCDGRNANEVVGPTLAWAAALMGLGVLGSATRLAQVFERVARTALAPSDVVWHHALTAYRPMLTSLAMIGLLGLVLGTVHWLAPRRIHGRLSLSSAVAVALFLLASGVTWLMVAMSHAGFAATAGAQSPSPLAMLPLGAAILPGLAACLGGATYGVFCALRSLSMAWLRPRRARHKRVLA